MALSKLYERIMWANNTSPALNDTNLNKMSKGLDDLDDRVISLAGTIMEDVPALEDMTDRLEAMTENPPYIGANGNWYTWDTSTGAYVDSGVDASVSITIGSTTTLPAGSSATCTNSGSQTDAVFNFGIPKGDKGDQGVSAYAQAVDGGYTGTEAQFESDLANFGTYATNAADSALDSEAWAKGTRNGTNVGSSDPAYHANSFYYAHDAYLSYTHTVPLEQSASTSALKSEGYALGEQNGTAVTSGSPYYENNAKYYADLCAQYASSFDGLVFKGSIAYSAIPTTGMTNGDMYDINEAFVTDSRFEEGSGIACAAGTDIAWVSDDNKWNILTPAGVYSFNGRSGAVSPASGDYEASQITYNINSDVATALGGKQDALTISTGLTLTGSTLTADVNSVTVDSTGTASSSGTRYQRVGVNGSYTAIDGTKYMEQSTKATANGVDTFTFSNSAITSTSSFDVYTDVFGAPIINMVLSGNQLSISFNTSDNVGTCRLYIK